MKAIIIDDNVKFAEKLKEELSSKAGGEEIRQSSHSTTEQVSPEIEVEVFEGNNYFANNSHMQVIDELVNRLSNKNYTLCFINLDLELKNKRKQDQAGVDIIYRRQDQAGVDILYWLRLKKQFCNVILYSFRQWDHLLRQKPENTLLASEGSKYFRLPLQLNDLRRYLTHASKIRINEEVIRPHLHLDWRLAEFEKQDKHELANKFGAINFALAATQIGELSQDEFKNLRENLKSLRAKTDPSFEEYVLLRGFIDCDIESKTSVKEQKIIYTTLQKFNDAKGRPFKLLFIDDHWQDGGWGEVLRSLFQISEPFENGIAKSDYMELHCMDEIGSDDSFTPVLQKLELNPNDGNEKLIKWDMVILDLNLRGKVESTKEITERSGYKLLQKIREIDASLPVVVLSATEKAQNLKALQHLGINGFVSKHLYGEKLSQEFQQFIDSFEKTASKWYLRNFWSDIIWFKNSKDELWQDHEIERSEIVSLLKQCYFEIARNSLAFEKVFDRNAYNYVLQHCYTALYEIFYNEIIEGEEQSTGGKTEEMKELYPKYEGFLYFLKWLRNGVLHSNYQCTVYEGIFAFVGVIIVLMQQATTHSSDLVKWVLKELGVEDNIIPSNPTFSVSDLQNLLRIFKYWSNRRRYTVNDVVELSLVNFRKKIENDKVEAFFDLSFVNNYIVTNNVGNSLKLELCPQYIKIRILQKIAAAKSGNKDGRYQSIEISKSLLDNLPPESRRDQIIPPFQNFKIKHFDDNNFRIIVEPIHNERAEPNTSTLEPKNLASIKNSTENIKGETLNNLAQKQEVIIRQRGIESQHEEIEGTITFLTKRGDAILTFPNQTQGFLSNKVIKEANLSLKIGMRITVMIGEWNSKHKRYDCKLR